MGHIDLILSNGLGKEYEKENLEGLQVAMESGQLLLSIIQDILDLSKIEAGQLDIDGGNLISVRGMVENTMKLANAFRIQRKKDHIELLESVDASISDWVLGDQFRSQQSELMFSPWAAKHDCPLPANNISRATLIFAVLNNLISNAIKFTDKGFVSLDIRKCPGEDLLLFCVHDTGKGIPEDRLDLIFEPFRQCDFGDTRKHGGTGLGLTICRKLVELMGGTLRVESSTEPGSSGSRFYFTLPYHPAAHSDDDESSNQEGTKEAVKSCLASNLKSSHRGSGTILLAEDDDVSRKVAKRMVERAGFQVLEARDGAQAVSLFEQHYDLIDCIIMDIMMPGVGGIEATRRIRRIEKESPTNVDRVPIIALSAGTWTKTAFCPVKFETLSHVLSVTPPAGAMKGDKEKGLEAGMNDYLYKPISLEALSTKLGKFFGEK
eukprot:scaffold8271_cov171-Amphora_coffeaeformis.AAC.15